MDFFSVAAREQTDSRVHVWVTSGTMNICPRLVLTNQQLLCLVPKVYGHNFQLVVPKPPPLMPFRVCLWLAVFPFLWHCWELPQSILRATKSQVVKTHTGQKCVMRRCKVVMEAWQILWVSVLSLPAVPRKQQFGGSYLNPKELTLPLKHLPPALF
jgi:hypothetical protein